jgi:hypothetical protein
VAPAATSATANVMRAMSCGILHDGPTVSRICHAADVAGLHRLTSRCVRSTLHVVQ